MAHRPTTPTDEHQRKEKLVWLAAIGITVLIALGWFVLFSNGSLTDSKESGFFASLGNRIATLWDNALSTFTDDQTDETDANLNDEERQIKKLEEEVFPQFTDPTRQ